MDSRPPSAAQPAAPPTPPSVDILPSAPLQHGAPFLGTGTQAGWPPWGGPLPVGFPTLLPFQFPSLGHFDQRLAQVLDHLRDVDGLQGSTVHWVRVALANFRRFIATPERERALLGGDVRQQVRVMQAWVGAMRAAGLTHATVNNYWRALQIAFKRITLLDGMLSPVALLPTPRAGRRSPRFLTREAAERLLTYVSHAAWPSRLARARNLALVGLMLLAGLRRGEALRLLNGHVDAEAGVILILRGKGQHGGKDRTCYMPPQLRAIVRDYQAERTSARRTHPEFLTALTGDHGIGEGAVRELFERISRDLGMAVSPHALRHTFATLLRASGVPDRLAMDLLGHASLSMLQRYSHVYDGEHAAAAAQLALDVQL